LTEPPSVISEKTASGLIHKGGSMRNRVGGERGGAKIGAFRHIKSDKWAEKKGKKKE